MEAQIDRLCSTNWTDVECTFLVEETKYVGENIKPELKEIRFWVMHLIYLAQAVILDGQLFWIHYLMTSCHKLGIIYWLFWRQLPKNWLS